MSTATTSTDASTGAAAGPDLSVDYLGLKLANPLVVSSCPHTREVSTMLRLQAAGAAAVILPSLFQEEVEAEEMAAMDLMDMGDGFAEFDSSPLAEVDTSGLGPDRHIRRLEEAKAALSIPVIASLNAAQPGSWARYATMLADAGADAIELNLYAVNGDASEDGAAVEDRMLSIISSVKEATHVPLAVKLSQNYQSLSNFAARAKDAGADGLVLFNRFLGPDIDLEDMEVVPKINLSSPAELSVRLRWIAILRSQLKDTSLAATGGVHSPEDIVKALLVGSNVACLASVLLRHGPEHLAGLLAGLRAWLMEHEYESVRQLCGSMSHDAVDNPGEFERAQYIQMISTWSPA